MALRATKGDENPGTGEAARRNDCQTAPLRSRLSNDVKPSRDRKGAGWPFTGALRVIFNGAHMKCTGLILAAAMLAGCSSRTRPLPVLGRVPEFTLTAQNGAPFDSRTLEGKIWVSDFMFTTCTGPCPRMSSQMHWVGTQVADLPEVRLVSFTVDPEHDTPVVLAEYAKRFRADPGQWYFLTGPQSTLHHLDRDGFKLGSVDGSMTHSTRFVLVDEQGRIRGYYHTDEDDGLKQLVSDIRRLAKEEL